MPTTADGWADFNDIDSRGVVTVLLKHCNAYPQVTYPFTLGDGEGNWCQGVVVEVGQKTARIRLHLDTWRNAGEPASTTFVRGNPRIAELLSDPTIAAEVAKIEDETRGTT